MLSYRSFLLLFQLMLFMNCSVFFTTHSPARESLLTFVAPSYVLLLFCFTASLPTWLCNSLKDLRCLSNNTVFSFAFSYIHPTSCLFRETTVRLTVCSEFCSYVLINTFATAFPALLVFLHRLMHSLSFCLSIQNIFFTTWTILPRPYASKALKPYLMVLLQCVLKA